VVSGTTRKETLTFRAGETLKIAFEPFSVEIAFNQQRTLTVTVTAGENAGFSDTVPYEAEKSGRDQIVLSWQESIGTSVVHVIDARQGSSVSFVVPKGGHLLRLHGRADLTGLSAV
jgi:hypothetical protein